MAGRSRQGYSNRRYKAAKQYLRDNHVQCWVTDNRGKCPRRATTPDHQPPLATFPDPSLWEGQLLGICTFHSVRQRGQVTQGRLIPPPSRLW